MRKKKELEKPEGHSCFYWSPLISYSGSQYNGPGASRPSRAPRALVQGPPLPACPGSGEPSPHRKQCSFLGRNIAEVKLPRKDHLEKQFPQTPTEKYFALFRRSFLFEQPWVFHITAVMVMTFPHNNSHGTWESFYPDSIICHRCTALPQGLQRYSLNFGGKCVTK